MKREAGRTRRVEALHLAFWPTSPQTPGLRRTGTVGVAANALGKSVCKVKVMKLALTGTIVMNVLLFFIPRDAVLGALLILMLSNFFHMMWRTKIQYSDLRLRRATPDPRFDGGYPEWKIFDDTLSGWTASIAWGTLYALIYLAFATHWWCFLLLPFHWVLGPIHGAIVNWAGHKVGYRNYESTDNSKNTLVFRFAAASIGGRGATA